MWLLRGVSTHAMRLLVGARWRTGAVLIAKALITTLPGIRSRILFCRKSAVVAAQLARTPLEKSLSAALLLRFPRSSRDGQDTQSWDIAFANALVEISAQYPASADVHALTAEALICITPWALWNVQTGEPAPAPARTLEAVELLQKSCDAVQARGDPPHPGLCHLMIHAMEMSPFPERALPQCDALVKLACGTGHLTHMPTHIYILVGDYEKSVKWNDTAAAVDRHFLEREDYNTFYTLYATHNSHFKMYAAMFLGHYEQAAAAAEELEAVLTESFLRRPSPAGCPFANLGDGFIAMKYHLWVRFGRWQEILAHPLPADQDLYCVTVCTAHYARSLAHALGDGDMVQAREEQILFETAFDRVPLDWEGVPNLGRLVHNNRCRDILEVSRKLLEGELAYRDGRPDEAFELLRQAGDLESSPPTGKLVYDEPWGFMQPTRHALGALLMDQGRLEEAEKAYREDLGLDERVPRPYRHPLNVWALHGYCEAMRKQGKPDVELEGHLKRIQSQCDTEISASCFCRPGCGRCNKL